MKKRLLVLGMIACLLGATACGTTNVSEASVTIDAASQLADTYISTISSIDQYISSYGYTSAEDFIDENASGIETYWYMTSDVCKTAYTSYSTALEDLGTYQGIESVSYTEKGDEVTITATVIGDKVRPDGKPRTAQALITVDVKSYKATSILFNVDYTFGELMTTAGLNTLLGIGTVFMVLVILMALISCFKIVNKIETSIADKKANKDKAAKLDSVDNAVAQITGGKGRAAKITKL